MTTLIAHFSFLKGSIENVFDSLDFFLKCPEVPACHPDQLCKQARAPAAPSWTQPRGPRCHHSASREPVPLACWKRRAHPLRGQQWAPGGNGGMGPHGAPGRVHSAGPASVLAEVVRKPRATILSLARHLTPRAGKTSGTVWHVFSEGYTESWATE